MYTGTETPLGGAATFASNPRMANRDDRVVGVVFASHAGNVFIEQSYDPRAADVTTAGSANWDLSATQAVVANTGASFSIELVAPYWRLRYVNGATPQTIFRLHAKTSSGGDS